MPSLALKLTLIAALAAGGCAPAPRSSPAAAATGASKSILAQSRPVAGSTVEGDVNQLELWFDPPARLVEVVVAGPDGEMPMMITAVGEVGHYSIPTSLSAGAYRVTWRASASGREHGGSYAFTVR